MQHISLLKTAHNKIKEKLPQGGFAIDATVGNGHDTVFLAEQVGKDGVVYGFDIQQAALDKTRVKLEQAQLADSAHLFLASHEHLADYVAQEHKGCVHAAMFNLGYLAGADKSIITQVRSTLKAVQSSLKLLAPNSILTIIAYPGHPGGQQETEAIANFCDGLDRVCFTVEVIKSPVSTATAPRLFMIYKHDVAG
jgi:predicted methyltransferase